MDSLYRPETHPPNAAARPIAPWMRQRDFVVADDAVIEVEDVHGAVGTNVNIDGAEPRVVGGEEVGLLDGANGAAVIFGLVAIDAAGHDVAAVEVAAILFGEILAAVFHKATDGRAAVQVVHHRRDEAEAVVWLAEAGVVAAAQELIDGFGVAVGGEDIEVFVKAHAEGIDLAVREVLDAAAVELEAEDVARLHVDFVAIAAFDATVVVKAVAGVDPAVPAAAEAVDHAVRVAAGVEGAVEDGSLVADAVAIGVFKMPDVGDAEGDAAALPRVDAHRNVEAVGEGRYFFEAAVAIYVFEDANRVF